MSSADRTRRGRNITWVDSDPQPVVKTDQQKNHQGVRFQSTVQKLCESGWNIDVVDTAIAYGRAMNTRPQKTEFNRTQGLLWRWKCAQPQPCEFKLRFYQAGPVRNGKAAKTALSAKVDSRFPVHGCKRKVKSGSSKSPPRMEDEDEQWDDDQDQDVPSPPHMTTFPPSSSSSSSSSSFSAAASSSSLPSSLNPAATASPPAILTLPGRADSLQSLSLVTPPDTTALSSLPPFPDMIGVKRKDVTTPTGAFGHHSQQAANPSSLLSPFKQSDLEDLSPVLHMQFRKPGDSSNGNFKAAGAGPSPTAGQLKQKRLRLRSPADSGAMPGQSRRVSPPFAPPSNTTAAASSSSNSFFIKPQLPGWRSSSGRLVSPSSWTGAVFKAPPVNKEQAISPSDYFLDTGVFGKASQNDGELELTTPSPAVLEGRGGVAPFVPDPTASSPPLLVPDHSTSSPPQLVPLNSTSPMALESPQEHVMLTPPDPTLPADKNTSNEQHTQEAYGASSVAPSVSRVPGQPHQATGATSDLPHQATRATSDLPHQATGATSDGQESKRTGEVAQEEQQVSVWFYVNEAHRQIVNKHFNNLVAKLTWMNIARDSASSCFLFVGALQPNNQKQLAELQCVLSMLEHWGRFDPPLSRLELQFSSAFSLASWLLVLRASPRVNEALTEMWETRREEMVNAFSQLTNGAQLNTQVQQPRTLSEARIGLVKCTFALPPAQRTADSPTLSQFQRIYTQLRLADLPYGWGALLPSLEAVAAVATNTPTPTQSLAYDPAAFLLESPASTLSFDRQHGSPFPVRVNGLERAGSRPDRPPVAPARPGPDGELALQLESFVTFGESTPDDVVRFHVATPNEDEDPAADKMDLELGESDESDSNHQPQHPQQQQQHQPMEDVPLVTPPAPVVPAGPGAALRSNMGASNMDLKDWKARSDEQDRERRRIRREKEIALAEELSLQRRRERQATLQALGVDDGTSGLLSDEEQEGGPDSQRDKDEEKRFCTVQMQRWVCGIMFAIISIFLLIVLLARFTDALKGPGDKVSVVPLPIAPYTPRAVPTCQAASEVLSGNGTVFTECENIDPGYILSDLQIVSFKSPDSSHCCDLCKREADCVGWTWAYNGTCYTSQDSKTVVTSDNQIIAGFACAHIASEHPDWFNPDSPASPFPSQDSGQTTTKQPQT